MSMNGIGKNFIEQDCGDSAIMEELLNTLQIAEPFHRSAGGKDDESFLAGKGSFGERLQLAGTEDNAGWNVEVKVQGICSL
jgi:hypothetical protein